MAAQKSKRPARIHRKHHCASASIERLHINQCNFIFRCNLGFTGTQMGEFATNVINKNSFTVENKIISVAK